MKNNKKSSNKGKVVLCQMASFAFTILILALVGLIIPLRPSYSESEKRELAKFPKLSIKSLTSGDFFDEFSTWYSDTYPGRETLVGINSKIKSIYGINSKGDDALQIHGEVIKGDDIPDEYNPDATEPTQEEPSTEDYDKIEVNGDTQSLGAVFVVGNRAFEYYNFNQTQANNYIATINKVADDLQGKAKVYDMIVPTSIGITLPDSLMGNINSSDQKKAIDYLNSGLNDNVIKVPIYSALMNHRSEYIYFNTDHHWTALGAYYAYNEFANVAGIKAHSLDSYEKVEFTGFLGSFYNDTGKIPALEANPDTIIAYRPNPSATFTYTDNKGNKINWKIINDVTNYPASVKYSCFIAGDNPYSVITNPDITDGSSILVIKESFGNALIPFLVENYGTVHIIDYRYYSGSITKFANDNSVDTVLYINNVSAIRNKNLVSKLGQIS